MLTAQVDAERFYDFAVFTMQIVYAYSSRFPLVEVETAKSLCELAVFTMQIVYAYSPCQVIWMPNCNRCIYYANCICLQHISCN
jgi:hypothetical protein